MDGQTRKTAFSGWLGKIERPLAETLLAASAPVTFADGQTIYSFEQPQDSLFCILSGTVRMIATMNEQEPRFVHIAGPGFWFGETEVVSGQPGIMEMIACGETRLVSIERRAIDRLALSHRGLWQAIALLAVCNLGLAIGVGEDLMIRASRKRLIATLLRLGAYRNAFQGVDPFARIPVTQADLAEAANLSRSAVAALLLDFEQRGWVRRDYAAIMILDPAALAAELED